MKRLYPLHILAIPEGPSDFRPVNPPSFPIQTVTSLGGELEEVLANPYDSPHDRFVEGVRQEAYEKHLGPISSPEGGRENEEAHFAPLAPEDGPKGASRRVSRLMGSRFEAMSDPLFVRDKSGGRGPLSRGETWGKLGIWPIRRVFL